MRRDGNTDRQTDKYDLIMTSRDFIPCDTSRIFKLKLHSRRN